MRCTTSALTRGTCPGIDEPLIGILLVEPFPFEIAIESAEVGGPSAGLMWALGLYDLLTPGDLTRGRTIAGTGAIDLEGNIGPIGGSGRQGRRRPERGRGHPADPARTTSRSSEASTPAISG